MCNYHRRNSVDARLHDTIGDECSQMCEASRLGLPLRSTFALTEIEDVTLDVARLILATHVSGEARYWHMAIEHAEMQFASLPGATLLVHVTALVRVLLRERQLPFTFLGFCCRHISSDEIAFVSLLQALQIGTQADVDDALEHLAQGGPVHGLRAAAAGLTERMQAIIAAMTHPAPSSKAAVSMPERSLH